MAGRGRFNTTALLANPAAARKQGPFSNDAGMTKPSVTFDDDTNIKDESTNEEDDYEEGEEPEDGDEGWGDAGDDGGDDAEYAEGDDGGGSYFGRESIETQQMSIMRQRRELLVELEGYIKKGGRAAKCIPLKEFNMTTPSFDELQETVMLCRGLVEAHTKAASLKFGVNMLNNATKFIADTLESANATWLDPDDQFTIDGYGDHVSEQIEAGTFEDVHERMWEKMKPYIGGVENPFVQWAFLMSYGVMKYNKDQKKQIESGRVPDPRKLRKQIADKEAAAGAGSDGKSTVLPDEAQDALALLPSSNRDAQYGAGFHDLSGVETLPPDSDDEDAPQAAPQQAQTQPTPSFNTPSFSAPVASTFNTSITF